MRTMTLEEWDVEVGQFLKNIRVGAVLCERGVRSLVYRPFFETLAEGDLVILEELLETALRTVRRAQQELQEKPHVS
jgi:hypothetical protein